MSVAPAKAFSKKKTDDRKEWLTNFMEDRRQRRLHGLPEVRPSTFTWANKGRACGAKMSS